MEFEYEYSTEEFRLPLEFWIVYGAILILVIAATWKVFTKAGRPGWASLIPVYNIYIMTKIGGKPGYWTLLCLIPFVGFVYFIWLLNMISKSFGKDGGFTFGLVIAGFIFWPILGFGDAKYLGPYGDPAAFAAYQDQHKFDFEEDPRQ